MREQFSVTDPSLTPTLYRAHLVLYVSLRVLLIMKQPFELAVYFFRSFRWKHLYILIGVLLPLFIRFKTENNNPSSIVLC